MFPYLIRYNSDWWMLCFWQSLRKFYSLANNARHYIMPLHWCFLTLSLISINFKSHALPPKLLESSANISIILPTYPHSLTAIRSSRSLIGIKEGVHCRIHPLRMLTSSSVPRWQGCSVTKSDDIRGCPSSRLFHLGLSLEGNPDMWSHPEGVQFNIRIAWVPDYASNRSFSADSWFNARICYKRHQSDAKALDRIKISLLTDETQ